MKIYLTILLFPLASIFAQAQESKPACEIPAQWITCSSGPSVFDQGCTVECKNGQRAVCESATALETFDPSHPNGSQCQLIPSSCRCKK